MIQKMEQKMEGDAEENKSIKQQQKTETISKIIKVDLFKRCNKKDKFQFTSNLYEDSSRILDKVISFA